MDPVPTTLEQDLFGDEPEPAPDTSTVARKEEQDLDDLPHQAMAGVVPVPPEPAPNPTDFDDADSDEGGLFGDGDDDDEEDDTNEPAPAQDLDDDGLTAEERKRRQLLEYEEYEGDEEGHIVQKDERVAQIELANFDIPKQGKVWHARLPNFIDIKSEPFDDLMWEPEDLDNAEESQESTGTSGHGRGNVPDENVIRWRWQKDEQHGNLSRQSNARIVRWSDGSLSLEIGSELFDVGAAVDHSALIDSVESSAEAKPRIAATPAGLSSFEATTAHGLTYVTAQHPYTELIEAQASIHGTLTFRPSTLQSKTHKRLAGNIAGRYVKGRGIKMAQLPEQDPEKLKADREKAELDRQKKLKREAQRAAGGAAKRKGQRRETRLEGFPSDDEDLGSYADRRSQPKRGRGGPLTQDYDDEDEEMDDGFVVDDEEAEDRYEYSEDDIEKAEGEIEREEKKRKESKRDKEVDDEPTQAVRRRMVVDDSDEE